METLEPIVECDFDSDDDAARSVGSHLTVHLRRKRSSQPLPRSVAVEVEGESDQLASCSPAGFVTVSWMFLFVWMTE
jgi:hypothetical protein